MTGIPDDATRTGIWAEVPCDKCNGTGCDELTVADYEVAGIDIDLDDDDLGTPEYADDCFDCDGTGTRTVITDIEVEPSWMVPPASVPPSDPPVALDPHEAAPKGSVRHWAEVDR